MAADWENIIREVWGSGSRLRFQCSAGLAQNLCIRPSILQKKERW